MLHPYLPHNLTKLIIGSPKSCYQLLPVNFSRVTNLLILTNYSEYMHNQSIILCETKLMAWRQMFNDLFAQIFISRCHILTFLTIWLTLLSYLCTIPAPMNQSKYITNCIYQHWNIILHHTVISRQEFDCFPHILIHVSFLYTLCITRYVNTRMEVAT